MNSIKHAQISARRHGGVAEDYLDIHQFIDSTKNLCSDNRHRIFHTLWAVNEIVLPIFGHQITNSDGVQVDVKDICEKDHLLVDFRHRFIPTLADFVQAMQGEITPEQQQANQRFHSQYALSPSISRLLLSPLAITGQLKSLLITHNSWFLLSVLPRIPNLTEIQTQTLTTSTTENFLATALLDLKFTDFELAGEVIFTNMRFEQWMNQGADYPPSARYIQNMHQHNLQ